MGCVRAPVTLLDAVTSSGAGPTIDLGEPRDTFSVVLWSTSGSGSGSSAVALEGSHDGVHWFPVMGNLQVNLESHAEARLNGTIHVPFIRGKAADVVTGAALTLTVVVS